MVASIRLKLEKGKRPPPDHNAALGAAVYTAHGEAHPREAVDLHRSPKPSPYVLSEIHPARGAGPGAYWFRLGCIHAELGQNIVGALVTQGELRIKDALFRVEGVQDVTSNGIEGPVAFHTLSPILLRDSKTKYCFLSKVAEQNDTGPDPAYGKRLEEVANHALRTEQPEVGQIEIGVTIPGKPRKRELKGRTIYAQTVKFYIDGPSQALKYILERGLGWSRSHGFGCLALHKGS